MRKKTVSDFEVIGTRLMFAARQLDDGCVTTEFDVRWEKSKQLTSHCLPSQSSTDHLSVITGMNEKKIFGVDTLIMKT